MDGFIFMVRVMSRVMRGALVRIMCCRHPIWYIGMWNRLRLQRKVWENKRIIRKRFCMLRIVFIGMVFITCIIVWLMAEKVWLFPLLLMVRLRMGQQSRVLRELILPSLLMTTDKRICFGDRLMPKEPSSVKICVQSKAAYGIVC